MTFTAEPYCGTAPLAADLWSRWNLDPWVIAVMLMLAWLGHTRGRRDVCSRRALAAALALMFIAFISPLCALASALFSARVAHHLLLIAGAAPLLAMVFAERRDTGAVDSTPALSLTTLTLAHALIVWVWHSPSPYLMAMSSDSVYWLMQLSLLFSGLLLWRRILSPRTSTGTALFALLATMMQMGLLGALLVFAPRPVFTPHFGTTASFGLTALQDQQLAGLLMWVPAMLPYLAAVLMQCAALLRRDEVPTAR